MSGTPETDKTERRVYANEYMVPTEFSRKMERERNEALKELNAIRAVFGYGVNEDDWIPGTPLSEAVGKVLRERDEAREALQYIAHSGLSARFLENFARDFLKRLGGV